MDASHILTSPSSAHAGDAGSVWAVGQVGGLTMSRDGMEDVQFGQSLMQGVARFERV